MSRLARISGQAIGWVIASILGWTVALILNQLLSYVAPFNPFTPSGFAIGTFVTGGLFGLIVALPQSLAIRRGRTVALRWIAFNILGFSMALFVGNSIAKIFPALESLLGSAVQASVMGFWIGLGHWLATSRYLNRSILWATVSGGACGVALLVGGLIGSLALVGGGLIYGVLTAYPFVMLVVQAYSPRTIMGSA